MKVAIRMTSQAYRAGVIIVTGTDNDPKEFVQKEMELIVREVGMSTIDKTRRVSCPYREVA